MTEITDPRYDSKPTQPKDPGTMSRNEEDELFDATLERDDVAASVWEAIIDEIGPEEAKEIVTILFRRVSYGDSAHKDFCDAGRLIFGACAILVEKIVEGEEHNTDMSKD